MLEPDFIEPDLIDLGAGYFAMGSEGNGENEAPVHRVWIDAFALAKYPVSRREYALFIRDNNRQAPAYWDAPQFQCPDQPVVAVTWFDAAAYCQWLGEQTGKLYRLPTEAEREKAARGGVEGRAYPWGDELPQDHRGGRDTELEAVGSDGPNGYGLYDMAAGVHEWCADFHSPTYYAASPYRNPQGPESGARRVARGGAWRHEIRFSRCAARSSLAPDKEFSDFGFRCAMTFV